MAYATPDDLAEWMGEQAAPSNATRLLERASELVDEVVVVWFDPDDEATAKVLADATCAQVEFWSEAGDTDVEGQVTSASIGQVSLQYGSGSDRAAPNVVARRTLRVLRNGGLMYRGVPVR